MKKAKLERREFEGNVLVTVSEHEVRVWVCDNTGQNIFRFKAIGEVYKGGNDVMILAKEVDE